MSAVKKRSFGGPLERDPSQKATLSSNGAMPKLLVIQVRCRDGKQPEGTQDVDLNVLRTTVKTCRRCGKKIDLLRAKPGKVALFNGYDTSPREPAWFHVRCLDKKEIKAFL